MQFGVFASGHLGFKTVLSLWERNLRPYFLFCDKNSTELIAFAKSNHLPCLIGSPRGGKGFLFLHQIGGQPDFILSINYLFLLEKDIIFYPKHGCVNFHGSLLPKYRGRTPHVWAIINNEKKTGITAHYIDEGCDTGDIIFQQEIIIENHYTGADVLALYERQYPDVVEKTIQMFLKSPPIGTKQDETKATYHGKRTPADGLINWNWQKERIYNWIRAQADPYPGAFCFYNNVQITIDRVEFTDTGFHYLDKNGIIVKGGETPEIKTPNGVMKIVKCREAIMFKQGELLQ